MLILWCNTSHKKTATEHNYHKDYSLIINVSSGEYQ
ncbi:Uncharacterised protein [Phocaeicola vulgatus]|jgi:hypothetical protein|nr:Uncharacterised protein [Phocaeicola vulgatus]CUQ17320.1 Uncharacterised protein [Parabacteroides distasonis]